MIHFEAISAHGNLASASWGIVRATKAYDPLTRGFVFDLKENTKAQMRYPADRGRRSGPASPPFPAGLPFMILQLFVPSHVDFSFEVGISVVQTTSRSQSVRRMRLLLSTSFSQHRTDPLHSQTPISALPRDTWVNLVIDLRQLVEERIQSVDSILVNSTCKLRRIILAKHSIMNQDADPVTGACVELPSSMEFLPVTQHTNCQILVEPKIENSEISRPLKAAHTPPASKGKPVKRLTRPTLPGPRLPIPKLTFAQPGPPPPVMRVIPPPEIRDGVTIFEAHRGSPEALCHESSLRESPSSVPILVDATEAVGYGLTRVEVASAEDSVVPNVDPPTVSSRAGIRIATERKAADINSAYRIVRASLFEHTSPLLSEDEENTGTRGTNERLI